MVKFKPANALDQAAIFYIKYLVEKHFWNKNHKEIEKNPFENTGGEIVATGQMFKIEIKAYDWHNEKDGYLNFYFDRELLIEFRWHKHCLRGLEVRSEEDWEREEAYDKESAINFLVRCLEIGLETIEEK